MSPKWSVLVACAYFGFVCETAFVDTLHKCSVKNEKCQKDILQYTLKYVSENGLPELNIPPVENLELNDLNVSVMNMLNITILQGKINGLKNCAVSDVEIPIEKGSFKMNATCDYVVIEGKHKVTEQNHALQNIFGQNILHGAGSFKIDISKIQLNLNVYYHIEKREGEIYFKCHPEEFHYNYNIGDLHADATGLYLGNNDASKTIVQFMNQSWKFMMQFVGNNFMDIVMKIVNDMINNFYEKTPVKYFFIEDLTKYVKD